MNYNEILKKSIVIYVWLHSHPQLVWLHVISNHTPKRTHSVMQALGDAYLDVKRENLSMQLDRLHEALYPTRSRDIADIALLQVIESYDLQVDPRIVANLKAAAIREKRKSVFLNTFMRRPGWVHRGLKMVRAAEECPIRGGVKKRREEGPIV